MPLRMGGAGGDEADDGPAEADRPDRDEPAADPGPDRAVPEPATLAQQSFAAANAAQRRKGIAWMAEDPLGLLITQRNCLEPLRQFMTAQFDRASENGRTLRLRKWPGHLWMGLRLGSLAATALLRWHLVATTQNSKPERSFSSGNRHCGRLCRRISEPFTFAASPFAWCRAWHAPSGNS